jgi:hypothetical protein
MRQRKDHGCPSRSRVVTNTLLLLLLISSSLCIEAVVLALQVALLKDSIERLGSLYAFTAHQVGQACPVVAARTLMTRA